jgi:hypothetical protein
MRGCLNAVLLGGVLWLLVWFTWQHPWQGILMWILLGIVMMLYPKSEVKDELRSLDQQVCSHIAEVDRMHAEIRDMRCPKCGERKL